MIKSIRSVISGVLRNIHRSIALKKVLVLGDSHVEVFGHRNFIKAFPFSNFDIVSIGGATVSGLENPRSKTQANHFFEEALKNKKYDEVIVMLGEVDTGFVIWYRALKYGDGVEKMFQQAVDNYQQFLEKIMRYTSYITVVSTPLPTIDDTVVGEVAHARKEVTTSQLERTTLTLRFNSMIEDFCNEKHIRYLNLDKKSIGEDGVVKILLKNKNPSDHHYDFNQYSKIMIKKWKKKLR